MHPTGLFLLPDISSRKSVDHPIVPYMDLRHPPSFSSNLNWTPKKILPSSPIPSEFFAPGPIRQKSIVRSTDFDSMASPSTKRSQYNSINDLQKLISPFNQSILPQFSKKQGSVERLSDRNLLTHRKSPSIYEYLHKPEKLPILASKSRPNSIIRDSPEPRPTHKTQNQKPYRFVPSQGGLKISKREPRLVSKVNASPSLTNTITKSITKNKNKVHPSPDYYLPQPKKETLVKVSSIDLGSVSAIEGNLLSTDNSPIKVEDLFPDKLQISFPLKLISCNAAESRPMTKRADLVKYDGFDGALSPQGSRRASPNRQLLITDQPVTSRLRALIKEPSMTASQKILIKDIPMKSNQRILVNDSWNPHSTNDNTNSNNVDKSTKIKSKKKRARNYLFVMAMPTLLKSWSVEKAIATRALTLKEFQNKQRYFIKQCAELISQVVKVPMQQIMSDRFSYSAAARLHQQKVDFRPDSDQLELKISLISKRMFEIFKTMFEEVHKFTTEPMLDYMYTLTSGFIPDGFLSRFELSRLSFTEYGRLNDINSESNQMMIGCLIYVKILVQQVIAKGNIHAVGVPSELVMSNLKFVASYVMHVVLGYLQSITKVQFLNQAIVLSDKLKITANEDSENYNGQEAETGYTTSCYAKGMVSEEEMRTLLEGSKLHEKSKGVLKEWLETVSGGVMLKILLKVS